MGPSRRGYSERVTLPVVLLPSLGRTATDFDGLVAALRAAGFDALALDPPTELPENSTLHELAQLVIDVLDERGWDRVHLIGHAFGQRVARCVVADHSLRVATLTMLAGGGLLRIDQSIVESLIACFDGSLSPDEHLRHVERVFFAPGNDPSVWVSGFVPAAAAVQLAAVRATPHGEWSSAAAGRVLVVQGLQDACTVPENGRRYLAMHPGRTTLVEIDGAGNALLPERPDQVAAAVIAFLCAGPE